MLRVLLLVLVAFPVVAGTVLEGKVVKVADGDTITVLVDGERHRVRLQGIDAPERKQAYGKARPGYRHHPRHFHAAIR